MQENNNQIITVRPAVEAVYKYMYQGQERQDELGLNLDSFKWRNYDYAIGRFNKIDRFSDKYYEDTPYHFSKNNPIYFIEMAGDSIITKNLYIKDKSNNYIYKSQIKAFEFFINTNTGKKYLSLFASKGQKIAGFLFKDDGKYHKKGIDLSFGGEPDGANNGDTGVGNNNNGKPNDNGRYSIEINIQGGDDFDVLSTLTHEIFIHADRDVKDILDNGILDNSNIDKDLRKKRFISRHHFQENRDARKKDGTLYSTMGYQILKQGNKKYKKYENNKKVWNSMWHFTY